MLDLSGTNLTLALIGAFWLSLGIFLVTDRAAPIDGWVRGVQVLAGLLATMGGSIALLYAGANLVFQALR